ncbi:MAG: GreA/GreB family elongation factor [Alphaproteobacteria bacterium]|jgi:regulator of nucleoside diphosphate kinase|nr:GreA/GreB family elongation factor [Alphaproteobacteria bacterium]
MPNNPTVSTQPQVLLSTADFGRLEALASASVDKLLAAAVLLLNEIDRAEVRPKSELPDDVVVMGSHVEFRDEASGAVRRVQIVYPHEADIAADRISVLTLIGAALIGLRVGQSIDCPTVDGQRRALTVLGVE